MALIACSECGKQISDKAVACPNCGAPIALSLSPEAARSPAKPQIDGKVDEHVILQGPQLLVSTARVVIGTATHAVKNVNSCRLVRVRESKVGIVVAGFGGLGLICAAAAAFGLGEFENPTPPIVLGLICALVAVIGVWEHGRRRGGYRIYLTTSGADVCAVKLSSRSTSDIVVGAINDAIVGKRSKLQWPETFESPPPQTWPAAAVVVFLPLVLVIVHAVSIGDGAKPLWALVVLGVIILGSLLLAPSVRERTPSELLDLLKTNKSLAGALVGSIVVAEIAALATAVPTALAKRRIERALQADDACAAPASDDMAVATDAQRAALRARWSRCDHSTAVAASASSPVAPAGPTASELAAAALGEAWSRFTAEGSTSPAERAAAYRNLQAAVSEARKQGVGETSFSGKTSSHANQLLGELDALAKEDDHAEAPELPVYDGAFRTTGRVRRCYQDGVAIESDGKLLFVKDAVCPDAPILYGWVEDTGETVSLDFGRDGRSATVVDLSDKEKAQDDRRAFNEKMAEYANALAAHRKGAAERSTRAERRKRLEVELDAVLVQLAKREAAPPSASSAVPSEPSPPNPTPAERVNTESKSRPAHNEPSPESDNPYATPTPEVHGEAVTEEKSRRGGGGDNPY